jgi:hypothetical protein
MYEEKDAFFSHGVFRSNGFAVEHDACSAASQVKVQRAAFHPRSFAGSFHLSNTLC